MEGLLKYIINSPGCNQSVLLSLGTMPPNFRVFYCFQSIPQKIRKKPTDYKLRAFVGLMFLAIVFFVGFAYVLYHQQALTKAYFDSVQFNEPKRLVRIFGKDDVEILRASLGVY